MNNLIMELWQFLRAHCDPGGILGFLVVRGRCTTGAQGWVQSVTMSWLCQSSESGDQVGILIGTPLFEGVLYLCFLLSHVCIVTSERPGKTAILPNVFWKNWCCLVFRRKPKTLFQKISVTNKGNICCLLPEVSCLWKGKNSAFLTAFCTD